MIHPVDKALTLVSIAVLFLMVYLTLSGEITHAIAWLADRLVSER